MYYIYTRIHRYMYVPLFRLFRLFCRRWWWLAKWNELKRDGGASKNYGLTTNTKKLKKTKKSLCFVCVLATVGGTSDYKFFLISRSGTHAYDCILTYTYKYVKKGQRTLTSIRITIVASVTPHHTHTLAVIWIHLLICPSFCLSARLRMIPSSACCNRKRCTRVWLVAAVAAWSIHHPRWRWWCYCPAASAYKYVHTYTFVYVLFE